MKSKQQLPNRRLPGLVLMAASAILLSGHFQSGMAQSNTFPSTGNAGIGTTTPADPLHVTTGAAVSEIVRVESTTNSSNVVIGLKDKSAGQQRTFAFNFLNTSGVVIGQIGYANNTTGASQFMNFNTNSAERMRIDGSGNVGIGTASPTLGKLQVAGMVGNTSAVFGSDGTGIGLIQNWGQIGFNTYYNAGFKSINTGYGGTVGVDQGIGGIFFRTADTVTGVGTAQTQLERMRIDNAGNVGIGTASPGYKLDVAGQIRSSTGGFMFPNGTVQTTAATMTGVTAGAGLTGGGTSGSVTLTNDDRGSSQNIFKNVANAGGATQFSAGSNSDALRFEGTGGTSIAFDALNKKVTIDSSGITSSQWTTSGSNINYATSGGNVGVGQTNPNYKLDVNGTAHVSGNLTVDGNLAAKYQDLAEWVPASEQLPAGTVVVLDSTKSNHVTLSTVSYDTRVAGVISARPGIALGESGANKVLVATTGRVRVKVDATRAPIQVGDLLVTSDMPGVAMKSEPVNLGGVQLHRPGTLIGKALEPLAKGSGEILVLLSLQ